MADLDKEIADSRARTKRLVEKKRIADAKKRARFVEALGTVVDGMDNDAVVTIRDLVEQAQAMVDEQDAKRREASRKAAAKRRQAAQVVSEAHESESHNEMNEATENQTVWGDYRVDS